MPESTTRHPPRFCPHLIPILLCCPACAEEQHDAWKADQLARLDPEPAEQRRREFEAWLATNPPVSVPEVF